MVTFEPVGTRVIAICAAGLLHSLACTMTFTIYGAARVASHVARLLTLIRLSAQLLTGSTPSQRVIVPELVGSVHSFHNYHASSKCWKCTVVICNVLLGQQLVRRSKAGESPR